SPLHGGNCSAGGRAPEPEARVARRGTVTKDSDVIHAVTVVVADNIGLITGLAESFLTNRGGRALQRVPGSRACNTCTPDRNVSFVVAVIVGRDEEVGRDTPGGDLRRAAAVTVEPGNLAGRAAAGVANHREIGLAVAIEIDDVLRVARRNRGSGD